MLALPIGWGDEVGRAKKPRRLPVVFTREEARAVLGHLREEAWLMASLLYGSGLRLMECARLRAKSLDLARLAITVRDGKGGKGRVMVLPASLVEPLERQLKRAQARCTRRTSAKGSGTPTCRTRWRGNTLRPTGGGAGIRSSAPATTPGTHARAGRSGNILRRRHCRRR